MTKNGFIDSRRDLRERAFQALFSLEFEGDMLEAAHFAYTYDKAISEETEVNLPAFLMNLIKGWRVFYTTECVTSVSSYRHAG